MGDQTLASRPSSGRVTPPGSSSSTIEFVDISSAPRAEAGAHHGGCVDPGSTEGTLPIMGIRKTVEIGVSFER
jgi:hypothetical protein